MVSVYLTSGTSENLCLEKFRASAKNPGAKYSLVDNPEFADIILFVENYEADSHQKEIRKLPLVKKYRGKIFCFLENDNPVPMVRGVYACIPKRFYNPSRVRTGPYVWMFRDSTVTPAALIGDEPYLFSFQGNSATHPVRQQLLTLKHERSAIRDTSEIDKHVRWHATGDEQRVFFNQYDMLIQKSKFILCPRGEACSSIRFFEAMRAGRVPVLISDDYVLPQSIDFDSFVVRVTEASVQSIPTLLESIEHEAIERGRLAREAYERLYAGASLFNYVVDSCVSIRDTRKSEWTTRDCWEIVYQTVCPPYLRNYQRQIRKRLGLR